MRVLSEPIRNAQRVGMLRVGDPLTPVQDAQSEMGRTFVLIGAVALALALAVGVALATLIAAPLRRMARVAAAVETGALELAQG